MPSRDATCGNEMHTSGASQPSLPPCYHQRRLLAARPQMSCSLPPETPAAAIDQLNNDMVWMHNLYRARHPGTGPLTFNYSLALDAAAYSLACIGDHNVTELDLKHQGENL